jgi:type I restriction enzyme S subunit
MNVRFEGFTKEGLAFLNQKQADALKEVTVRRDDVLLNITGASIGRVTQAPAFMEGARVNQHVCIIRPFHDIDAAYVSRYLASPSVQQMIWGEQYGVTRQALTKSQILDFQIPLAPPNEQRRIVERIDALFEQVTSARDHLSRVPMILKRFRQAVLAAACSGRLTEDWRAEHPAIESGRTLAERIRQSHVAQGLGHGGQAATPTEDVHNVTQDAIPDTWAVEELKVLCQPGRSITYGILKPGPNVSGGVPYIRVADFPNNRLKLEGIRRTTKQIADMYRRSALHEGDLLLSIRGTAGRVCRVPAQLDGANITQDTARISIHRELSSDYVEFYLQSPSTQKRLEAAMKGVAVRGVNIGDVRVLQVALPPRVEQDEIVRRIGAMLKIAEAIEQRLLKATVSADKLAHSILAKAFRGELVLAEAELARREGREYEPASVVLERIRAEKENHVKASPATKRKLRKASAHV